MAWVAWDRCFKKISKKPRLKGKRNPLRSIPLPDPIKYPTENRVKLPLIGSLKFHKQDIPEGKIKCGRMIKRASGWYLCLFIDAHPQAIKTAATKKIGIDPGFQNSPDDNRQGAPVSQVREQEISLFSIIIIFDNIRFSD